jgi:hypothetical protein
MALDYEKLIAWQEPEIIQRYSIQDTILYGLSLGYGSNPIDENELCFVYERQLKAVPSMATILASPWGWLYRAKACQHACALHLPIKRLQNERLALDSVRKMYRSAPPQDH